MWLRIRQVIYYLFPRTSPHDSDFIATILNPQQQTLFCSLSLPDQAHAIRVARRMQQRNAPRFALEAALLHDCGKPADFRLWMRIACVIATHHPLLTQWAQQKPWFQIYHQHDDRGIQLAEAHGSTPEALALLHACLQDSNTNTLPWLKDLKQCDDLG